GCGGGARTWTRLRWAVGAHPSPARRRREAPRCREASDGSGRSRYPSCAAVGAGIDAAAERKANPGSSGVRVIALASTRHAAARAEDRVRGLRAPCRIRIAAHGLFSDQLAVVAVVLVCAGETAAATRHRRTRSHGEYQARQHPEFPAHVSLSMSAARRRAKDATPRRCKQPVKFVLTGGARFDPVTRSTFVPGNR